ncbi:hypothetical protein G195_003344 [Phytophthora kernoviae 00238/432]|uniref:EF-hand domain-containing protein n=1 Tax=Phytophthora kernoviae 00238/432 TaxID=1284355 RepID=A0A8J4SNW4_9STRA|nr:hypothetical protein G195_003344 [Phytophthora kernoviae 00238/432]
MDVMMNMTTEDIRRLRGQFTGSLALDAFVRLMKKCLRDRIHSELDFVVGVIELFHTIDVNGDAVLDWDEFTAYMMDAGQAKADFYFEGRGRFTKHYMPLLLPPPDAKTPMRNIKTRVQQMRLLVDQNAAAYFEENSDVVYIYGLQFNHNEGPRHLSTMRLHTAFQEHTVIDVVYVTTRKSLVTSSVLGRGYLSVWSMADLYSPVMTYRLESLAAQEHLCWVPSLQSIVTSAVIFPSLHSGKQSDPKRDCYRPNAGSDQPHTKFSQLELWDFSGKIRPPAPGTIATKEVTVVQERFKGVTALVAFRSINRTYLAVGREDGVLCVVDAESGDEMGSFDAHGNGVKVLVYSTEVENLASVGFHSYTDETTMHISIWKKTGSGARARAMTAVCVDDRERKVIVGDDTGSIKVLNLVNGNVMKELDPHAHSIVDVAYVLYGKRVISISSDSVLHVCDENDPQGFYVPVGKPKVLPGNHPTD